MEEKQFAMSQEDEQRLRGFRLLDDDFMRMVFDDNTDATALLLNVIFDRNDMKVLSVVSQREVKNVNGHSVRFDIYAEDSEGRFYDIEIQRQDKGAGERRARFNSSMLDTKLLKAGEDADALPDSYVIFITERDVRKQNRPIYRFHRRDDETNELFDDGSHIIFVNGAYKNEATRIGQLMHDFRCVEADDMHNKILADKVRYFKETEGGRREMCKAMEEMRNDAVKAKLTPLAWKLLAQGKSVEEIADFLEITVEEAKELLARKIA